jgi:acyl-CoA ligase (AMP-forming) (exosortase A-associated)
MMTVYQLMGSVSRCERVSNLERSSSYRRIEEALAEQSRAFGKNIALVDGSTSYTYGTLSRLVQGFAKALQDNDLEPGDRAAVYLDKTVEAVIALYGIWTAGGVAVPLYEGSRTHQVKHILRHSGSKVFITHRHKLARLDRSILDGIRVLDVNQTAVLDVNKTAVVDAQQVTVPLAGGSQPAAILYTSGSTGRPKGILVSHDNLIAGTRIVVDYLSIGACERIISILPFSFDYGLNQLLSAVERGATLILQRSHFPADICRALVDYGITGIAGVPPLWAELQGAHSPFQRMSFPKLRYMTNSGGVFPVDLVQRYRRQLPEARIFLMYGLSEAFRSTYLPPGEIDVRPHSIGKAIPETEIYVLDEEGRECGPGLVGELVHRGPTVALEYWQEPEATREVFRPNPFATCNSGERVVYSGDLVRKDDDGYLYFVGRRNQMLKVQGFRVSPQEVEEILFASGAISEVAVCGEPDAASGMAVVAHYVPRKPEQFSVASLLSYCQREMPHYMVPRSFHRHASLPRTSSGKVNRNALTQ